MDLVAQIESDCDGTSISSSSDDDVYELKTERRDAETNGRSVTVIERNLDCNVLTSSSKKRKRNKQAETSTNNSWNIPIISSSQAPPDLFIRSIPHRKGYWAGHVKIVLPVHCVPRREKLKCLHLFQEYCLQRGYSQPNGIIVEHVELHISLSKHFSLQIAQLESFVTQLYKLIQLMSPFSLLVDCSTWIVLKNDDNTRVFGAWSVPSHPSLLSNYQKVATMSKTTEASCVNIESQKEPPIHQDHPGKGFPHSLLPKSIKKRTKRCLHNHNNEFAMQENEKDVDSSSSTSYSSSFSHEENILVPVYQIHCTFGTNKEYVLPLLHKSSNCTRKAH